MTNAEHIIAWAVNDRDSYHALCRLEIDRKGGHYLYPTGLAAAAHNLINMVYRKGRKAGDIVEEYSALDLVEAMRLALEWEVEA